MQSHLSEILLHLQEREPLLRLFKKNTDKETKNPDKEKTQRKEFKLYLFKNSADITHK